MKLFLIRFSKVNSFMLWSLLIVYLMSFTSQQLFAQKQKKFDEAIAKGWIETKGYGYEDKVEGESKREKFKEKALSMGYFVNYFGVDCVYFCKISEKEKLENEIEYEKRGKEYEKFKTGKQISGSNFKKVGTAFVFFVHYTCIDEFGGYGDFRQLQKCTDVKWTGQLKNGLLEGDGDGYCRLKKERDTYNCAFSGSFHDGFMTEGTAWFYKDDPKYTRKYDIALMPFSEGMSFMTDKRDDKNERFFSIVDTNGNVISNQYRGELKISEVIQNYTNGKAIVNLKGMIVDLNTKGQVVGISDKTKTILPGVFSIQFHNNDFRVMKHLTLPPSTKIIKNGAFNSSILESIVLPEGLKEIEETAFWGSRDLKSITIPSSVTKIGKRAFMFCSNLTSVTFPASLVEDIKGLEIFYGCKKLEEVNVIDANGQITKDNKWYWKERDDPAFLLMQKETEKKRKATGAYTNEKGLTIQDFYNIASMHNMQDVKMYLAKRDFVYGYDEKSTYYTHNEVINHYFGFKMTYVSSSGKFKRSSISDFMMIRLSYDTVDKCVRAVLFHFPYKELKDAFLKSVSQKGFVKDEQLSSDNLLWFENKNKDEIKIQTDSDGTFFIQIENHDKYYDDLFDFSR